jgi:hypothetical protein
MFLDHTQRRSTVGMTPLDEWSALRRDLYLTTHDTHNRQISMPPVGFEPTISVGDHDCSFRRSSLTLQANCGDNCIVAGYATSYGCVDSVSDFRLLTGYCNKINVRRPSSFRYVPSYYGPEFYNGHCLQEIRWWCQHFKCAFPRRAQHTLEMFSIS